jgi:hypothetical protein
MKTRQAPVTRTRASGATGDGRGGGPKSDASSTLCLSRPSNVMYNVGGLNIMGWGPFLCRP